tara:strand:+ start:1046 stop:1705 length:660 start_codon:yes stop_codon:yes gene_type:complete
METNQLLLVIAVIILLISTIVLGYIVFQKSNCDKKKNEKENVYACLGLKMALSSDDEELNMLMANIDEFRQEFQSSYFCKQFKDLITSDSDLAKDLRAKFKSEFSNIFGGTDGERTCVYLKNSFQTYEVNLKPKILDYFSTLNEDYTSPDTDSDDYFTMSMNVLDNLLDIFVSFLEKLVDKNCSDDTQKVKLSDIKQTFVKLLQIVCPDIPETLDLFES